MLARPRYLKLSVWLLATSAIITGFSACGAASTTTQTTATPPPIQATATATAIVVDGVAYKHYTDPTFGFSLDIPSAFTSTGYQRNASNGGADATWYVANPSQGLSNLEIATAINSVPASVCQGGTPITVGSGLQGYEIDNYATPIPSPNPGEGDNSAVSVSFISQGVWIYIKLQGTPPADTFIQRDDAIWHEILASFMPGTVTNSGNPCNG